MEGLDHELVDSPLNRLELALELAVLGGGDARGDDGSRDVASASQGCLGFDKDVRNVLLDVSDGQHWNYTWLLSDYLFFAKQGKMQENFERFRVSGEDDELGDTTVQGLRG